jgi:penicillin-binding protein 1A
MEKVYRDKELGYNQGPFPKATVKISKKYNCVSPSEPRRRAETVDTIAADNLLERMNSASSGVPDSLPNRLPRR